MMSISVLGSVEGGVIIVNQSSTSFSSFCRSRVRQVSIEIVDIIIKRLVD